MQQLIDFREGAKELKVSIHTLRRIGGSQEKRLPTQICYVCPNRMFALGVNHGLSPKVGKARKRKSETVRFTAFRMFVFSPSLQIGIRVLK